MHSIINFFTTFINLLVFLYHLFVVAKSDFYHRGYFSVYLVHICAVRTKNSAVRTKELCSNFLDMNYFASQVHVKKKGLAVKVRDNGLKRVRKHQCSQWKRSSELPMSLIKTLRGSGRRSPPDVDTKYHHFVQFKQILKITPALHASYKSDSNWNSYLELFSVWFRPLINRYTKISYELGV